MTLTEFKQLVKDMRTAQVDYFRTRDKDCLALSKRLEKQVDKALDEEIETTTPSYDVESVFLFPNGMFACYNFNKEQIPELQGPYSQELHQDITKRAGGKTEWHGARPFINYA